MTLTFRQQRQYPTLPAPPPKGPMPPQISVIIPITRTNLVTNPSIELATTGYTAQGGSIARSATKQYHGTYSLAITPTAGTTDGAYYTISLTAGQVYAFSCKFWGHPGVKYVVLMGTTAGVSLSAVPFVGTGRWQWISGYYLETSSTTRRLYFVKNVDTSTNVFYVDGVQAEAINAGETVSTYIDGDQRGLLVGQQPPAYLWTGTPHASTSTRSALTRAGGYLVNLQDAYNFLLTGIVGLGMAAPNNVSIPYTVLDGARYLRTTKPPRTISLPGRFQADDDFSLKQGQSDFRAAVDRDLVPIQQPLVLQVEPQDDCGNTIGDFAQIQCIYAGGLEGNDSSTPQEDAAPTFTMYVPYLIGGSGGASLTVQQSVSNANDILQRSSSGNWSALGTGANNSVSVLRYGNDGTLYAGGSFTDMGGSGADYIAQWNGSSWAVLKSATSLNGGPSALVIGADGKLYVGGAFTNADGIAAADYIASWDGTAWAALGTGMNNNVFALANAPGAILYAGGTFTTAGGGAANYVAKWNGSAWSALGSGMNGQVNAMAVDASGNLFVGGNFTTAGGAAAVNVAKWNGSTWSALGAGITGGTLKVLGMAFGPDGRLYVVGDFTTAGSVSASNIARWDGANWSALGSGLDNVAYFVSFDASGILYTGGDFSIAGGISVIDHAARWNGSSWLSLDIDLPSSATVICAALRSDGTQTLGFNTSGTATAPGITTVTNDTPGYVYPKVTIVGPSSGTSAIYQLINSTTGFGIWINTTISAGEVMTFNFDPVSPSYISSFVGDLTSRILPGSQPSLFYLAPGINTISLFAAGSSVTATVSWQKRYNGMADLVN